MARFAAVKHSRRKAHEAWKRVTATGFQKSKKVGMRAEVWRAAVYPGKKTIPYMAEVCFGRVNRIKTHGAYKCGAGYGKSPTAAMKRALSTLSKKLR